MIARLQDVSTSIGLLILRLGVGGYMASHGVGKFTKLMRGEAVLMEDPVGWGLGLSSFLIVFAEFFCALFVMAGFATRFSAAILVIAMAVAAFVAHGADPWSSETAAMAFFEGKSKVWFSKEPALLFLIPFLALVFTGAGKVSVDGVLWPVCKRFIDRRRKPVPTA